MSEADKLLIPLPVPPLVIAAVGGMHCQHPSHRRLQGQARTLSYCILAFFPTYPSSNQSLHTVRATMGKSCVFRSTVPGMSYIAIPNLQHTTAKAKSGESNLEPWQVPATTVATTLKTHRRKKPAALLLLKKLRQADVKPPHICRSRTFFLLILWYKIVDTLLADRESRHARSLLHQATNRSVGGPTRPCKVCQQLCREKHFAGQNARWLTDVR